MYFVLFRSMQYAVMKSHDMVICCIHLVEHMNRT